VQNAILDGEIACLDKNGVSRFYQLLHGKSKPVFYAFDVSWLDGEGLRPEPLLERKNCLSADKPFFRRPNLAS
jgi:bifunctional non-homologous end joining protein LigD